MKIIECSVWYYLKFISINKQKCWKSNAVFSLFLFCSLSFFSHFKIRESEERKLMPVFTAKFCPVGPSFQHLIFMVVGWLWLWLLAFSLTELSAFDSSDVSDSLMITGFWLWRLPLVHRWRCWLSPDFIWVMLDLRFLIFIALIDFWSWHAIVSSSPLWGLWHLQASSHLQRCLGVLSGESMSEDWFVSNWSFIEAKIIWLF